MLDASNPELSVKSKKPKTVQSRSAQRFWPESLVQTIQGTSSTIQFPPQATVHIISAADVKDGLHPIPAVVSTSNALSSSGIRILNVESRSPEKPTPVLGTLNCSTQPMTVSRIPTMVNNEYVTRKDSSSSPSTAGIQKTAEADAVVTNSDLPSVSQLQITASQVSCTFT